MLDKLVKYGIKNGADEIEIFVRKNRRLISKSDGYRIINKSSYNVESSIRIVINKRIANLYATTDNPEKLKELILNGINLAKNIPEDPKWQGLPYKREATSKVENWSEELEGIAIDSLSMRLKRDLDIIKKVDNRIVPVSVSYNINSSRIEIANSNDIYVEDKINGMLYAVELKGKENDKEASTFDYKLTKNIDINSEEIIRKTSSRVIELLHREELKEPYTGPIALDPVATSATFFFSLARAVSGTAVMEGYSPLKNKKGKEVGGKELTIYDNGILKGGWNSRRYDDEGVPRQNTILIVKGVLKSYIHNTYTARAMDEESTGNAFRQRGLLDVGITNLYIKPSNKSVDKLLSSYDSLIYIKNLPMGVHTTNYITGTINMVSTEAYIVKKGSIEGVLRPVTITGNIYEAMKEIEVADDLKETFYYTYSPTIVLGKFTIA